MFYDQLLLFVSYYKAGFSPICTICSFVNSFYFFFFNEYLFVFCGLASQQKTKKPYTMYNFIFGIYCESKKKKRILMVFCSLFNVQHVMKIIFNKKPLMDRRKAVFCNFQRKKNLCFIYIMFFSHSNRLPRKN